MQRPGINRSKRGRRAERSGNAAMVEFASSAQAAERGAETSCSSPAAARSESVVRAHRKRGRRGGAMVEFALMMPWILFLFMGIYDFGFYAYAAICVQNAARAAAINSAQPTTAVAGSCQAALNEMAMLPNIGPSPSTGLCGSSGQPTSATPVIIQSNTLSNSTTPKCADCSLNSAATSIQVAVTYQTVPLFIVPGALTGRLTLTRVAEVRVVTP